MQRHSLDMNPLHNGRGQGSVLRLIYENEGLYAKELAEMLDIRPASLTNKLDQLEADGNIKRVRDPKDMRLIRLYMTEHGVQTLDTRKQLVANNKYDFVDCLTPQERELFDELCEKLINGMEENYRQSQKNKYRRERPSK